MNQMWGKFNTLTNQFSKITEITKDLLKDDREGEDDDNDEHEEVNELSQSHENSNPQLRRINGDGSAENDFNSKQQNKTVFLTQLVQTQKEQVCVLVLNINMMLMNCLKLSSLKSESARMRKQLQDKDRQLEHVMQELSELRTVREVCVCCCCCCCCEIN